jgi:hypothetical protein
MRMSKKEQPAVSENPSAGKGRPTPSRKEREAAARRPLVGSALSKEEQKALRERQATERARNRAGILAGEEKFLGPRDRGPQRRIARDTVDARFTLGQILIPLLLASLLITSLNTGNPVLDYQIQVVFLIVMWSLLGGVLVDGYLLSRKVISQVKAKYGETSVERGLVIYTIMRAANMRLMRLPRPQNKLRDKKSGN